MKLESFDDVLASIKKNPKRQFNLLLGNGFSVAYPILLPHESNRLNSAAFEGGIQVDSSSNNEGAYQALPYNGKTGIQVI